MRQNRVHLMPPMSNFYARICVKATPSSNRGLFFSAEVLCFCKVPFFYGSKWMAAVYFLRIFGGQTVAYGSCFSDAHELAGGKKALDDFTGCRTADA